MPAVNEIDPEKQEHIKAVAARVNYDPETGVMTWKRKENSKLTRERRAGCVMDDGYVLIHLRVNGRKVKVVAHRVAWFIVHGRMPEHEIDHKNGIRSENWIDNLRDVPRSVNTKNAALRSDNKSGVSGVFWDKGCKAWRAQVRVSGKRHGLGRFTDLEAAKAALSKFRAYHGFTERHGA